MGAWRDVGLACVAATALACAAPAERRYRERIAGAPEAAVHAVHGERLLEHMRGLDRLARDRLPRSLDVSAVRTRRVADVVLVAEAIAASAAGISDAAGELGLDAGARAEFAALAASLEQRARRLAEDAPQLGSEALEERVGELQLTCDDCHVRFRLPRE